MNERYEELKADLIAAEAERRRKHNALLRSLQQVAEANVETLLTLTPNHEFDSCSDADPCNWGRCRCDRCALLHAKQEGFQDTIVRISVEPAAFQEDNPQNITVSFE